MRIGDIFPVKGCGQIATVQLDGPEPPDGSLLRRASDGREWRIVGVDCFALLRRPKAGDTVGLLLDDGDASVGDEVTIVINEGKGAAK